MALHILGKHSNKEPYSQPEIRVLIKAKVDGEFDKHLEQLVIGHLGPNGSENILIARVLQNVPALKLESHRGWKLHLEIWIVE